MLLIADEVKAIGVAGVMGGANSEISEDTKVIVFESANFNGPSVRRTATALGMRTESSSRFEKGLDPENVIPALERACELVELLGCGRVVDGLIDVNTSPYEERTLPFEPDRINALLGTDIPASFMVEALTLWASKSRTASSTSLPGARMSRGWSILRKRSRACTDMRTSRLPFQAAPRL